MGTVLLIPTDDYTAKVIDDYQKKLSECFVCPGIPNKPGAIKLLMNKAFQHDLAVSCGLYCARSWELSVKDGRYSIPSSIVYPCFIKPLMSFEGGKKGMVVCHSENELRNALMKLVNNNNNLFPILAQEYLSIDEEYDIPGVSLGDKSILAIALKKTCISKAHPGTTIQGIIKDISILNDIQMKLQRLLEKIRFYGLVDIEIILSDGKWYFNEVNFRSSAVCYAAVAAGCNLPAIYVDYMLKGVLNKEFTSIIDKNKTVVCEKAAWDDYYDSFISSKRFNSLLNESDYHILFNQSDPVPMDNYYTQIKKYRIRRWIKRIVPISLRRLIRRVWKQ